MPERECLKTRIYKLQHGQSAAKRRTAEGSTTILYGVGASASKRWISCKG